ncbi:MAG: pyridoxal-phosphate dependent enzyme [Albidovulum sp.]|nr:pyridoxal-phosphate dependent enzyme [Albidovulum sp.]MDE0530445.1 pyridoxal-phosphate dependent enzyme [Albidovulum sp.]
MSIEPPTTTKDIRAAIAKIPRVSLACLPTPLQEAKQLSKALGGPRIFVKRDDLTGVAFGGNKTRNLEFRLAAARASAADTIVMELDQQSNSARQTVGCCNRLGKKTILILEGSEPECIQGNLLVDHLLGAEVRFASSRSEQRRMSREAVAKERAAGRAPCLLNDIPMFDEGSAIAYLECACEIVEALEAQGLVPDCIYMSSSGKGQAGLILAQQLLAGFQVRGITATSEFDIPPRGAEIANRAARTLGLDVSVSPVQIINDDSFVGEKYGIPSEAGNDAVRLFARTEGIVLDPVYTGKAAAGMIEHIRRGDFGSKDIVVFVHTGGTPAIFAYNHLWLECQIEKKGGKTP